MVSFLFGKMNKCSRYKAVPLNNFRSVPIKNRLQLVTIHCREVHELQFIHFPGRGVWMETNPECKIRKQEIDHKEFPDMNRFKRGINSYRRFSVSCRLFVVIVPGSQSRSKISETIVECLD